MFSAETLTKFAREVAKYPAAQKQSAVMACLAHAQEEKGWLPPEAIEAVANYLEMAPMAAYEVASFYNMYDLKPVGKYKLTVCTNLPCALSGGYHAGDYIQKKLGITYGETDDIGATVYTALGIEPHSVVRDRLDRPVHLNSGSVIDALYEG